ncbi:LysE family translocator [Streptomyces sp. NPDC001922]|uniref:LysE family translocator n=1 Tax=Streptomyces sp. NPDC001922 TaxID=3364624 RepID=UPI0036936BAB
MEPTLPEASTLALFFVTALALIAVPGPNMLFILSQGVVQGRRAAFAAALGVELGTLVHVLGTVAGLSALIAASALAFDLLKYAGVAYLLYLAVRALRAPVDEGLPGDAAAGGTALRLLRRGALVNILNPKVALFFLALLPQYVAPERGSVLTQSLVLGLVFFLVALGLDLCYALASSGVARWLARHERFRRSQKYVTGGTYLALAGAALFAGRPASRG